MEKVGFFGQDASEPSLAFDEQVDTKKRFGGRPPTSCATPA
jgi:hypothetical protein